MDCQWRDRNLSDFIKNILICVPKMNKSLMSLEWQRVSKLWQNLHFWVNYPFNDQCGPAQNLAGFRGILGTFELVRLEDQLKTNKSALVLSSDFVIVMTFTHFNYFYDFSRSENHNFETLSYFQVFHECGTPGA